MIVHALYFGVLLALILFSERVRAYAIALLVSVAGTALSEWLQANVSPPTQDALIFFKIPSYVDAFVFSAIAILIVTERVRWWHCLLCTLSLVTAIYGAWFWWAYYLGVSVDPYYVPVFQGLFLISVAILGLAGGNDVFERVGSFLASLRNVSFRPSRPSWVGRMRRKAVLEKRA